jgi:hypothetical protein
LDSEGVPALVVNEPAPTKVRWWNREPPEELPGFAKAVWWAGHGQIFIAVFLAVVAPVVLVVSQYTVPVSGVGTVAGGLGTAMALPFATSGAMLRSYAGTSAARADNSALRILWLTLIVLLIAAVSIVFTFFCVVGLIMFAMSVNRGT